MRVKKGMTSGLANLQLLVFCGHFAGAGLCKLFLHGVFQIICLLQFPAALMNVIEELSLKDSRKVNLFYFLFWSSLYQLLTVGLLFWADIVPEFGYAKGIQEFGRK